MEGAPEDALRQLVVHERCLAASGRVGDLMAMVRSCCRRRRAIWQQLLGWKGLWIQMQRFPEGHPCVGLKEALQQWCITCWSGSGADANRAGSSGGATRRQK